MAIMVGDKLKQTNIYGKKKKIIVQDDINTCDCDPNMSEEFDK